MDPENLDFYSLSPEEQFKHPMVIEVPPTVPEMGLDGFPIESENRPDMIKVYDVVPFDRKHDTPVMFIPGWTGTAEGFKQNILELANLGWQTLGVTSVHGIKPTEGFPGAPEAEVRKMNALLMAIDKKELDQVDLVIHSEGALFSTLAATAHPEKLRNLVLDSPAGLIGPDNWKRLLGGFTHDAYDQLVADVTDKNRVGMIHDSFSSIWKALEGWESAGWTIAQVQAIIGMQIGELLKNLKRQGHGVVIMHHVDDHEFPMKRVQKIVTSEMVDGFLSLKGRHHEMLRQPKLYAQAIDHVLTALENKPR